MAFEEKPNWKRTAGLRFIVLTLLIAVLTPFYLFVLLYLNLPLIITAALGLIIILMYSIATAYAAIAIPEQQSEGNHSDSHRPSEQPRRSPWID
ncbi:MAG: hypothetical protein AAGF46_02875 [Pseudomonadota bacterium]